MQKIVFIVPIIALLGFSAVAQIDFTHLTSQQGLLSSNVRCIRQDYQGFMWIGTEDGLQRFDGNSMVSYRHEIDDSLSLSSNIILVLFEDSKKNLWIGTLDGGLLLYDREHDNFKKIGKLKKGGAGIHGKTIISIIEYPAGVIIVRTEGGRIHYFNSPKTINDEIVIHDFDQSDLSAEQLGNNVFALTPVDKDHNLWMGFHGYGVAKVDIVNNRISPDPIRIDGALHSMTVDSKNRLWLGMWDNGLYVVDLNTMKKVHFLADGKPNSLLHNLVPTIIEDQEGNIWIGTDDGVNLLRNTDNPFDNAKFIQLRHDDEDNSSLLSNPIKAITVDKDGRVWIGSLFGGVSIYDRHTPEFRLIKKLASRPGLNHNNVVAFEIDDNNRLWIGSDGGGINIVDQGVKGIGENNFRKLNLVNGQSDKQETKVKCLEKDNAGNMWIGTWGGGLFKVNLKTFHIDHYSKYDSHLPLPSDEITYLKADRHNRMWVGTWGAGLFSYEPGASEIVRYPYERETLDGGIFEKITCIFEDSKGKIWVARESGGFSYLDEAKQKFIPINNSILTNRLTIFAVHEDRNGVLWLGTNSVGLLRFNPKTNESERYDEAYGLLNPVINSIIPFGQDKLWVSTNHGISVFDIKKKHFTNYYLNEGLAGNQFNKNSGIGSKEGTILFGGINGVNVFHPEDIQPYRPRPSHAFTGFSVHNVPYSVRNGKLPKNIALIDTIQLQHDQNSFSVEFTALDYNFSSKRTFAFLLDGFNPTWQYVGNEKKATFTNLPPGDYHFKIKSLGEDTGWLNGEKELHIFIQPAWWQTVWFRASALLAVAGLFLLGMRLRVRYLQKQRRQLEALVKKRTEQLHSKNDQLASMVSEMSIQNKELSETRMEVALMNREIQAQNKELKSQNDQILLQREELQSAQHKLQTVNDGLEKLVDERTQKLQSTIRQLDKTVFELDRFVYSASHDLSAPLKSILGLLYLAQKETDRDRLIDYHKFIEVSIHKLELVIKSLVDYSRNAHMELQAKPTSLKHLVQEVIEELFFLPESKTVKFYNTVDDTFEINTDMYRLKLVLQNIISNAIKYSDHKKPESFVRVNCENVDGKVRILISDNGIGIEGESIPKIFSMYFRATERSEGSGLGLFIVKETVQKLQGKISVVSEKYKGSVFSISLPYAMENHN